MFELFLDSQGSWSVVCVCFYLPTGDDWVYSPATKQRRQEDSWLGSFIIGTPLLRVGVKYHDR